ncbi:hypothetical protein [Pseudobacteriovorax antillogorgiicola]|uniref:Uncharacterized protein n=1 Tax=Pseudobacteriovorax antillogorgiicola TaxID=1513793 RepID=A0A1Y6CPQ4_9BACT|nr:hypothetical protein [Pseudobacteriovorax antillogorgiicola]TCS44260.1 hypothetical protein EDD56_13460 [Pseudobacteriovorax antillogorgiicola]SMF80808.1 hypothetical protein SAMN06296036_13561 [Pseudobacteriovorax antillogorgiicola]
MRERTKIRNIARKVLKDLSLNAFSGRTSGIHIQDLPAALITSERDEVTLDSGNHLEHELELKIELIIIPKADAETEIEQLSEDVARALWRSEELRAAISDLKFVGEEFVIESHGEYVIAASEITFMIHYWSLDQEPDGQTPEKIYANRTRID